jgi:predicted Zn-dependent protease
LKWLSTHPLTPDRIDHLTRYIQDNSLGGSQLAASRHREIKSRLASTAGGS